MLKLIRYYTKSNYRSLVGYNYTNYINLSDYRKRRYNNNGNHGGNKGNDSNSNKKSKSNKDKDNKDNKLKNKVYITRNSNLGNANINIVVIKLDIITYFINLLFSARS